MTDANTFQNALRIMHSLDEVSQVIPAENVRAFHQDPMASALRMDAETWAKVYGLICARQKGPTIVTQSQWQPIGTAPGDGSYFLICQGRNGIVRVGRFSPVYSHWSTGSGPMDVLAEVTHWMPLPAAPKD
jgi:hypothetical protein